MCVIDRAWGQDGWILIGQVLFCLFIDQDKGEVDNNAKKNYQAWSLKDLLYAPKDNLFLRDQRGKSRAGKMSLSYPLG